MPNGLGQLQHFRGFQRGKQKRLRAFAQMRKLLKQIAQVNLDLLKERKRQRP